MSCVNDDVLRIRVSDDDRGGARLDGGTGLFGLRYRVETLGGRLRIQSRPARVRAGRRVPATDSSAAGTAWTGRCSAFQAALPVQVADIRGSYCRAAALGSQAAAS